MKIGNIRKGYAFDMFSSLGRRDNNIKAKIGIQ